MFSKNLHFTSLSKTTSRRPSYKIIKTMLHIIPHILLKTKSQGKGQTSKGYYPKIQYGKNIQNKEESK